VDDLRDKRLVTQGAFGLFGIKQAEKAATSGLQLSAFPHSCIDFSFQKRVFDIKIEIPLDRQVINMVQIIKVSFVPL